MKHGGEITSQGPPLRPGSRIAALEPGGALLAVLEVRPGRRLRPLRVLPRLPHRGDFVTLPARWGSSSRIPFWIRLRAIGPPGLSPEDGCALRIADRSRMRKNGSEVDFESDQGCDH